MRTRLGIELRAKADDSARAVKSEMVSTCNPGPVVDSTSVDESQQPALPVASESVAQLQQLAALHASGALNDAEFEATRAGLLS
jgi:Short C-terminal domain